MTGKNIFSDKKSLRWLIFILIATVVVYLPMLKNGFTYYSDDNYVLNNSTIQHLNWKNISFLFSSFFDGHYHPLTMLSLAFNYKISENNAFTYQLFNLILHLINTFLVFIITRKLFGNDILAIIVTILFGIHPIHVESVSRITERKDMLYSAFFFITMWVYMKFIETKNNKTYLICIGVFVLSLLSKGQAVSLPLSLLLIDFIKDRSLKDKKIWIEKIPFFILSIFFGILTLYAQKYTGYYYEIPKMPFYEPFLHAHYVFTHYISKLILPISLSAHYPYVYTPGTTIPSYFWIFLLVTPIIIATLYFFKKNKLVIFSILFYIVNIFIMLRIVPVAGNMSPDRYNYIPSFGFFIIIGLISIWAIKKGINSILIYSLLAGYFILIGYLCNNRVKVWNSGSTVWNDALKKYPDCSSLWQNIGDVHLRENNPTEAIKSLNKSLELDKQNFMAYFSLSKYYSGTNNQKDFNTTFNKCKNTTTASAQDYTNKSNVAALNKDNILALSYITKALILNPYEAKEWFNRGNVFSMEKKFNKSIKDYTICLSYRPSFISNCLYFRAIAYFLTGDITNAESDIKEAIEFNPKKEEYKSLLGNILFIKNNQDTTFLKTTADYISKGNTFLSNNGYFFAIPYYEKALKSGSTDSTLIMNLASCYYETGTPTKAINILDSNKNNNIYISAKKLEKEYSIYFKD